MSQSLSNVMLHLVFSTKNREAQLADLWRDDLHKYLMGIARKHDCPIYAANSVSDHIHILLSLSRNITMADLVKELKIGSSKWIKRNRNVASFGWQRGYGIFSISPSHKEQVEQYIRNQAEHHKQVSFQDEFRRLLGIYKVEYNEAYVWD